MFDLETISSIVAAISSLAASSDTHELCEQIVEIIYAHIKFYFVSLFLIDRTGEWAIFQAGTGEVEREREIGKELFALRYRLRVGRKTSLVSDSIYCGEMQFHSYLNSFASPMLPKTHWEIALPLRMDNRVMGALKVEGSTPADFSLEDARPFQRVADEIARKMVLTELA